MNPWLNLAAALLEALSRRCIVEYEPSYNWQIWRNKKSKFDLRNFGKQVAHIAYSFAHMFAWHALPHLQHMQVSFLATVKAPRDIYLFIGSETGIGYEAGRFSVVCLIFFVCEKSWLSRQNMVDFSMRSYLVGGKTYEWPWHVAIPVILATTLWSDLTLKGCWNVPKVFGLGVAKVNKYAEGLWKSSNLLMKPVNGPDSRMNMTCLNLFVLSWQVPVVQILHCSGHQEGQAEPAIMVSYSNDGNPILDQYRFKTFWVEPRHGAVWCFWFLLPVFINSVHCWHHT